MQTCQQRDSLHRMNRWLRLAIKSGLGLLLVLSCINASAQSDDFRVWTDSTGQHQVNAKLVERSEKEITLEKADGSKVTLPLDKLSEVDRQFLKALPAKPEPEVDPFAGGQPLTQVEPPLRRRQREPNKPSSTADESASATSPPRQPPAPSTPHSPIKKEIRPTRTWNYLPEPSSNPGARSNATISLGSTIRNSKIQDAKFSADGRMLLVQIASASEGELLLLDLVAGRVVCQQDVSRTFNHMAISPSGSRIAVRDFFDSDSIEIWDLTNQNLTKSRKNIDGSHRVFSGLRQLHFVDESHLLAVGFDLCLIDINEQRVEYEIDLKGLHDRFTFSTDGKHAGVLRDNGLELLRLTDGNVVGSIEFANKSGAPHRISDIAWNPKYLVAFMGEERQLWNLQSGQRQFSYPDSNSGYPGRTHFLSDTLILRGSVLYHIDVPSPVWRFNWSTDQKVVFDRDRCWLLTPESLTPVPLLDAERLKAVEQIVNKSKNVPILKRGTRVKLDFDFRHLGTAAAEAKAILVNRLQGLGVTIDDNAPVELRADVRRHQTSTLTKTTHRDGRFERTTASISPLVYDLMLVDAGRVVWRVHQGAELMDPNHHDENAHETQMRVGTPNMDFFSKVELPTKLSPQFQPPPPGSSKISADGVVK
ncbi:MAG: hypothetical protein JNL67_22370 [Planctomycetaceae bacterium]|nr:hypothetical protein [Planctomycetaceae bacterium]